MICVAMQRDSSTSVKCLPTGSLATFLVALWQMDRGNLLACERAAYLSFVEAMTTILDALIANRQLSRTLATVS